MISNSGSDERGRISGGAAGDQTGREWEIRPWYNRPWNCVLRHPDQKVREKIAELGEKAARNDKIGYDQNQRYTYWDLLVKAKYDPSKITVACESDCSAGIIANTKAVGHLLGITALRNIAATYTGNMRSAFKAAGFEVLTASKYLTSDKELLRGDILLNDKSHTATNLTDGANIKKSTTSTGKTYKINDDMTYTVRAGDTLSAIVAGLRAQGSKVSLEMIRRWNSNIKDINKIVVGQKLKLYYGKIKVIEKAAIRTGQYSTKKKVGTANVGEEFYQYGSKVNTKGNKWLKVWVEENNVEVMRYIYGKKCKKI